MSMTLYMFMCSTTTKNRCLTSSWKMGRSKKSAYGRKKEFRL